MLREFQEEIVKLKKMLENGSIEGGEIIQEVEEIEEIEEVEEIEVTDEEDGEGAANPSENKEAGVKAKSKSAKVKRDKKQKAISNGEGNVQSNTKGAVSETQLQAMQEQVEKEKQAILAKKDLEKSECDRLVKEAEARLEELEKERTARNELANKLSQLEQKLLVGGVNIIDQHEQQQLMLAKRTQELEEKARQQRELQRALEEHDEANLQIEEEFSNLQEEAAAKTRKLKRLWNMIQEQQSELKDVMEEQQREREDLLETIRELTTELKLRILIVNGFIPPTELSIIEDSAEYDDIAEKWRIAHIAHAGNNIRNKSSVSQHMHLALHRSNEGKPEPLWDPTCVFPDPYLTYDIPTLKNKRFGANDKQSAKKKGSYSSTSANDMLSSNTRISIRPRRKSNASSGEELNDDNDRNTIPQARGLVNKVKRYA